MRKILYQPGFCFMLMTITFIYGYIPKRLVSSFQQFSRLRRGVAGLTSNCRTTKQTICKEEKKRVTRKKGKMVKPSRSRRREQWSYRNSYPVLIFSKVSRCIKTNEINERDNYDHLHVYINLKQSNFGSANKKTTVTPFIDLLLQFHQL